MSVLLLYLMPLAQSAIIMVIKITIVMKDMKSQEKFIQTIIRISGLLFLTLFLLLLSKQQQSSSRMIQLPLYHGKTQTLFLLLYFVFYY